MPQRHRRIEVPARDVADREGHRQHRQADREGDRDQPGRRRGKQRRAADRADKRERADELGARVRVLHRYFPVARC